MWKGKPGDVLFLIGQSMSRGGENYVGINLKWTNLKSTTR